MYSSAAYCAYDTVETWDCGKPCELNANLTRIKRIHNSNKNTFGYTGYSESQDKIVLAFRGTNGIDVENWITNLKSTKVDYPYGYRTEVHKGFY